MKMGLDLQSSIFDLALEIRQLVSLPHSYIPLADREQMVVDNLIRSAETHAMSRHLFSVDTSMIESTV